MPDSDPIQDNPRDTPNLPAVVKEGEVLRPAAENWLLRAIRTLFGWKAGSVRADLQVVLDTSTPDEVGFSAIERTMLRNILDLNERRIADVMVHRADIVAVKRDIPLGELMSLFESAAHSRLVVYNETLDDPEGIVHIRDLLAFMTAKARVGDTTKPKRKKPFPAGLDLRAVDLALPLAEANIIRKLLFVPPSMRAIDLLAQMQASRIHLALVVDEYGGTDGLVSIEDIVEQIVGEIDGTQVEASREGLFAPRLARLADARPCGHERQQVADVYDALGVVEAFVVDDEPRMRRAFEQAHQFAERDVTLDRDDVGAMDHHVGDTPLVQAEDVAQHGALDGGKADLVRRRGIEHDLQVVANRSRLPAEQSADRPRQPVLGCRT